MTSDVMYLLPNCARLLLIASYGTLNMFYIILSNDYILVINRQLTMHEFVQILDRSLFCILKYSSYTNFTANDHGIHVSTVVNVHRNNNLPSFLCIVWEICTLDNALLITALILSLKVCFF